MITEINKKQWNFWKIKLRNSGSRAKGKEIKIKEKR